MTLFLRRERSAQLIGSIPEQLSRMRLSLREAAHHQQPSVGELPRLARALESNVGELQHLLGPEEARQWKAVAPRILFLRSELVEAASALELGNTEAADRLLDGMVSDEAKVMDDLAQLSRLDMNATNKAVRQARSQLRSLRVAEGLVSLLLGSGILATWWVVMRILRGQREQMARHLARVELANADSSAFAGRIAHDIRDVLNPLVLLVASIKQTGRDAVPAATSDRIERTTSRALGLLDALLEFSRAGAPSRSHDGCSAGLEARAVIEELQPIARQVDARVETELASDGDVKVRCSAGLLGIVLRNLLGNSLKYMAGCTERVVRIAIRKTAAGSAAIIISDTGPGIPDEALPRIFEPFYRVPGTHAPGTGIGLATVDRIIRAHGGRVIVRSVLRGGTTFEVHLPIAAPSTAVSARPATLTSAQ